MLKSRQFYDFMIFFCLNLPNFKVHYLRHFLCLYCRLYHHSQIKRSSIYKRFNKFIINKTNFDSLGLIIEDTGGDAGANM